MPENSSECISTPSSKLKVLVIPTNEELLIGRETYKQLRSPSPN